MMTVLTTVVELTSCVIQWPGALILQLGTAQKSPRHPVTVTMDVGCPAFPLGTAYIGNYPMWDYGTQRGTRPVHEYVGAAQSHRLRPRYEV